MQQDEPTQKLEGKITLGKFSFSQPCQISSKGGEKWQETWQLLSWYTDNNEGRTGGLERGGGEFWEKSTIFVKFLTDYPKRGRAKDRRPPPLYAYG